MQSEHATPADTSMAIGRCEQCGEDIRAPHDILVWAEEHTYHQSCYQQVVERRISHQVAV